MTPLFNLGKKFEHKNGKNLTERPCFFFWSSPNFGPKNGLILSGEIFLLVFISFKFSSPPFEISAYATGVGSSKMQSSSKATASRLNDCCRTTTLVPANHLGSFSSVRFKTFNVFTFRHGFCF